MSGEATVQRPSVVVVGGGFAGFFAAGALERLLPPQAADLTFISATDHLCYSPLLPEVAAGRLDPRRIAVPLRAGLRRTRVVQASVDDVDFDRRTLVKTRLKRRMHYHAALLAGFLSGTRLEFDPFLQHPALSDRW